jgi:hypothetical protein
MSGGSRSAQIKAKVKHEFQTYLWLSAYLYVVFAAIIIYKDALMTDAGIGFAPWGIAIVKALVLAKFLMVAEALIVRENKRPRPFPTAVAHRAILLALTLIVMTLLEEWIVGMFHGRPLAATLNEIFGTRWREFLASCLLVTMALVPYVGLRRVQESLDDDTWRRLMRGEA